MATEKEMRDTLDQVMKATPDTVGDWDLGIVAVYAVSFPVGDSDPVPGYPVVQQPGSYSIVGPNQNKTAEKLGAATQLIKVVHELLKHGNSKDALTLVKSFLKSPKKP